MPFEPTFFPRGGAGGAAARNDQNYLLADAETSTTGTTVSAWAQVGGEVRATLINGAADYDPDGPDYVSWLLKDPGGVEGVEVQLEDIVNVLMRVRKALPADVFAIAAITSGPLATHAGGAACGFVYNAAGNTAIDFASAGTWTAVTEASAREPIARCCNLAIMQSNGATQARVGATPIDGGLRPATLTNASTAPGAANVEIGGKLTHVHIIVGRAGAGVVNGVQVRAGVSTFTEPIQAIPNRLGLFEATPAADVALKQKIVVVGNSQVGTGGSGADADRGFGGGSYTAVPTSLDFSKSGVDITDWAAECASRPYMADEIIAQAGWETGTADFGWCEWWGSDGLAMTPAAAWRALLGSVFQAVTARDDGEPDLVIFVMSENDIADADEVADYLIYARDALRAIRYEWPDARILIVGCSQTDTGNPTYSQRDTARLHQQTLAAELGNCDYVDMSAATVTGDVHYSTGTGGGHNAVATNCSALFAAP